MSSTGTTDCSCEHGSGMKILVLMHESLIPPHVEDEDDYDWADATWISEYDVLTTLNRNGHEALPLGVYSDLNVIRKRCAIFTAQSPLKR